MWDQLWTGAAIATMKEGGEPFGLVERGALGVKGGVVAGIELVAPEPWPG